MAWWIGGVVVLWVVVLGVVRVTSGDSATCDNWCIVQHASWLVTVAGIPVALAGIWKFLLDRVGPTVNVGLAKSDSQGRTELVTKYEAPSGQPVSFRIGVQSSRFAREMSFLAEFQPKVLTTDLVSSAVGTIEQNTSGRVQWEVDIKNLHPKMTNVSEIKILELPEALENEVKIDLKAYSEGMGSPFESTVTLVISRPAIAPQQSRPVARHSRS